MNRLVAAAAATVACFLITRLRRWLKERQREHQAESSLDPDSPVFRARRLEAILARRTDRIVLVAEYPHNLENLAAIMRTLDCLGVQTLYVVEAGPKRAPDGRILNPEGYEKRKTQFTRASRNAGRWLTVVRVQSTKECVELLRRDGYAIWATDLNLKACSLEAVEASELPERLAVVMGNEMSGITEEMRAAADRLIYFPLRGFSESLNVSVCTALVLQSLLSLYRQRYGCAALSLPEESKRRLRAIWYPQLARSRGDAKLYEEMAADPPSPLPDLRIAGLNKSEQRERDNSSREEWQVKRRACSQTEADAIMMSFETIALDTVLESKEA